MNDTNTNEIEETPTAPQPPEPFYTKLLTMFAAQDAAKAVEAWGSVLDTTDAPISNDSTTISEEPSK